MTHSINFTIMDSFEIKRMCAGKDCQKHGTHNLEVKYLYKSGWFCDCCMEELLAEGLVKKASNGTEVRSQ